MWKKNKEIFIWVLIAAGFLLLPVADVRPYPTLPLYPLDFVYLGILISLFTFFRPESFLKQSPLSLWLALIILLLSSTISWFINGATTTGLGQLKSWLWLPSISAFLTALIVRAKYSQVENLFRVWLLGLIALLGVLTPYFLSGSFTFDGRFEGPFTSPNFLAFFLVPGIILCYFYGQHSLQRRSQTLFGVLGFLFLFFLFLTHSFGGWLALAGGFGWYFFYQYRQTKFFQKGIFLLLLLTGMFLLVELGTNDKGIRIFDERSSLSSRFTIWNVATQALKDHPFWGIGIGRFQEVYLSYQPLFPPFLEWAVPEPHNIVLALWLQVGILGLLVMGYLGYQALKKKETDEESLLLQALFVAFLVYGIFDTPLFGNALSFVWWLTLAFLLIPPTKSTE